MLSFAVVVLFAVFVLIAVRQVGRFRFQIWHVMLGGALAVFVTFQISPVDAFYAVNIDVMLFLFGMFVVGEALEESGYLFYLSHKLVKHARTTDSLVLLLLFGFGLLSALLLNDTLAIIGTPLVLMLAKEHKMSHKLLLLTLAFSVTIGSVMSPIGNPQNLLIALNGRVDSPFVTFFRYLFLPTIINIVIAYAILKLFFRNEFHQRPLKHSPPKLKDPKLALLAKISLILILILICVKVALVMFAPQIDFRLTYIALVAALPIIMFSPKRVKVLKGVDWTTLIFFASMFVLMAAVWNADFFQPLLTQSGVPIASLGMILLVSVLLSQFISNVPLVALYLPLLLQAGASTGGLMALAAGSTIAGNLLILGAASNVIIIQNAEKRTGDTLTFLDFAKVGIPLTVLNILVYWAFLTYV
jgi:Na+/H+ antiporter NhaD/arsenite permease-like protein